MKMLAKVFTALFLASIVSAAVASVPLPLCQNVTIEGSVSYGQSFQSPVTTGLTFRFEAIRSGWIVRVLPTGKPRPSHDYAELATPPYASLTPLAVSTDFSFRAQDAIGWNPRSFRFAADAEAFDAIARWYPDVMHKDPRASVALATLVAAQPSAVLTVLDARIAPGTNDQTAGAARVVSHFDTTPHTVDTAESSALGRIEELRFRVVFSLPANLHAAKGVATTNTACGAFGVAAR